MPMTMSCDDPRAATGGGPGGVEKICALLLPRGNFIGNFKFMIPAPCGAWHPLTDHADSPVSRDPYSLKNRISGTFGIHFVLASTSHDDSSWQI
jgi:hypothetical protein